MISEWSLYYKVKKGEWVKEMWLKELIISRVGTASMLLVIRLKPFDVKKTEWKKKYLMARRWAIGLLWRLSGASQLFISLCARAACVWCVRRCCYMQSRCSALFTLGLCESLRMETGGGGGIMSAPVFPSVTMKDVDWGHIEHRCSRNMKGPSNLMPSVYGPSWRVSTWRRANRRSRGRLHSLCMWTVT